MEQKYKGRLELTWTNKDKRLLAQQTGNYEWVSPSDYRVAEVRLLEYDSTCGDRNSATFSFKATLYTRWSRSARFLPNGINTLHIYPYAIFQIQ